MTFTQINYFIQVARCLNFTEAAARLYVTQPTLSRQITAIETELNMQLFIREHKSLRLTPAGTVLLEEFTGLMESYENGIKRAREASYGMIGHLNIGVIDGLNISHFLPDFIQHLENTYPNIQIHLARFSFSQLIQQLYDCKLDGIITYDFDVRSRPGIKFLSLRQLNPVIIIPNRHPLASAQKITLKDMANESLVIVNPADCGSGVALVTNACEEYGGFYPKFHFVDTMEDALLWVEAGMECALLNDGMNMIHSDAMKVHPLTELPPMKEVLAWNPDNHNFALPILLEYVNHLLYV